MRKLASVLAILMLVAGCEGPMGPRGPEGPQGPEGPEGDPAMLHTSTDQVNSQGEASVTFAGLSVEDAVVTCYLSDNQNGPWLIIGTDTDSATCGAGNSSGGLSVVVQGAPSGWWFMATAATGG